jgi:hypothetical protein
MTAYDTLAIMIPLSPKEALEFLLELRGIKNAIIEYGEKPERNELLAWTFVSGFHIDVINATPSQNINPLKRIFEFQPTVDFLSPPVTKPLECQCVTGFLTLPWNYLCKKGWNLGVAFENIEWVALKYHSDKLVLNSSCDLWTPERLKQIKLPYVLDEIQT